VVDGIVFLGAAGLAGVSQSARCDVALSSPTGEAGGLNFEIDHVCVQTLGESMF
jgi:hypothetical protein